jgi:CheY-like chemotaxis protein
LASRILVVDDEPHQRRSLSLGLRAAGFTTVEAESGAQALHLVAQQTFDLLITDLMMPTVNGIQLARQVQARWPDLPIVLTSGYELGRKHIERAGIRVLAFVAKPYDLAELSLFLHTKLAALSEPAVSEAGT